MDFPKRNNTSTGFDQTFTISASATLPDNVAAFVDTSAKSINWKAKVTTPDPDLDVPAGTTGPHKIYVTYGSPTGSSVVTEKRISWACSTANGQSTLQGIADAIYNDFATPPPYFQLGASAPSPLWLLMAGSQYKGECIDQANLMKLAIELLGGSASIGFVYGSSDTECYSTSPYFHEIRLCGRILAGVDGIANTTKSDDDVGTVDEDNDPYNDSGTLTSSDIPTRTFQLQGGNIGDTYKNQTWFQEFARLEIVGTWFVISDPLRWRVEFKFIKRQVTEALWNIDINGDGDLDDNITEAMLGVDTNGDGDQGDLVGFWDNNGSNSANDNAGAP